MLRSRISIKIVVLLPHSIEILSNLYSFLISKNRVMEITFVMKRTRQMKNRIVLLLSIPVLRDWYQLYTENNINFSLSDEYQNILKLKNCSTWCWVYKNSYTLKLHLEHNIFGSIILYSSWNKKILKSVMLHYSQ